MRARDCDSSYDVTNMNTASCSFSRPAPEAHDEARERPVPYLAIVVAGCQSELRRLVEHSSMSSGLGGCQALAGTGSGATAQPSLTMSCFSASGPAPSACRGLGCRHREMPLRGRRFKKPVF